MSKVIIRPAKIEDKGFILQRWLKGNYYSCDYFNKMDQDLYYKEYSKHIERLINKPGTMIDVAVLEDAPDLDIGYIVYNNQTLYWASVKRDYRKQGILNTLLKNMDFTTYTGSTPVGLAIGKKKKLIYNPLGE